jgi:hypothetical protein
MEPVSAPRRTGRKGSLENPEVLEDVPGHIIPILEREFDDFDNEAEKFLGGETPEDQFIGFRLKQGVYGQRQADVQMIRVKCTTSRCATPRPPSASCPTPGCRAARAAATRCAT